LTVSLPVINAAAQLTFLVSGESKAAIIREILLADGDSCSYPAAQVKPTDGRITWFITADAGKDLPPNTMEEIGSLE
jgi:6-phosphogluconolactonase